MAAQNNSAAGLIQIQQAERKFNKKILFILNLFYLCPLNNSDFLRNKMKKLKKYLDWFPLII